jgi:hypothetical protein
MNREAMSSGHGKPVLNIEFQTQSENLNKEQ